MSDSSSPFAFISRRRFLKWSLVGGGALLAASGGGVLALEGWAPDVDDLRSLNDFQYRTLTAIADTIVPAGGPFAFGAAQADIARSFDAFLADEPPENLSDLKLALHLVEFGPLLFEGRLRTFSRLGPEERAAHWQAWRTASSLLRRKVALAFTKFVNLVFYDRPEAWAHIGYPGPSLEVRFAKKQAKKGGAR